jgi:hypothetical protein
VSLCRAALVLALLVIIVAGCGPAHGPFANDRAGVKHLVLPLPDTAGVVIREVSGLSDVQSRAVRTALAEEFSRRDIAAAMTGQNRAIRHIDGVGKIDSAADGRQRVQIDWTLYDRDAKPLTTASSTAIIAAPRWQDRDPKVLSALVKDAAARFTAAMVEPAYDRADGLTSSQTGDRPAGRHPGIPLHIWPIAGPSNQANIFLQTAMGRALTRRGISVVKQMEQAQLILSGEIALGPPQGRNRPIEVIWAMLRPDGKELGRLNQRNTVSEATLKSGWGALSRSIAEAAAGAVGELIRRLPAEALSDAK